MSSNNHQVNLPNLHLAIFKPMRVEPFKYLRIIFIATQCIVVGTELSHTEQVVNHQILIASY
jgi:hypothetical protein